MFQICASEMTPQAAFALAAPSVSGGPYGRGTSDDKDMAAAFVTNLIRYRKEGCKPDRDIIVALSADEEIGGRWGFSGC